MKEIFHLFLVKPLLNALILFYNFIPGQDLGLAIIALTLLIRLILVPAFQKTLRSQKALQQLQPKIEGLKAKHKDDREAQSRAMLELYREHKVNPFSSCLPLLVQLPILIALYRVFLTGLNGLVEADLYPFTSNPGTINTHFLGLVELGRPSFLFAFLAGAMQFVQSKMSVPKQTPTDKTAALMNTQMVYFMPLLTVFIAASLPAGLSLYWVVTTVFAIVQQYYIMRRA